MANKRRCLVPETDLVYTIIDVNVKAFLNRFKDKVTNISPLVVAVDMTRITLDNLRHIANLFVVYGESTTESTYTLLPPVCLHMSYTSRQRNYLDLLVLFMPSESGGIPSIPDSY